MEWKKGVDWKNYVSNQCADPLKYFKPCNLDELVEIIRDADSNGYKVKAIGSGHSSSDIALTRDYMIDTHGLNRILEIDKLMTLNSKGAGYGNNLVLIECGKRLRDVNKALEKMGKALINMGAYTGQTIAGVISTSTHGSGRDLGAFPGYVEALILVDENGELHHIEPKDGISSQPIKFNSVRFTQDDEIFNSVIVSMGCMGLIYAVVLRVCDSYDLIEARRITKWADVKKKLQEGEIFHKWRHVEVLINPYAQKDGTHKCLVTKRKVPSESNYKRAFYTRGHRKIVPEILLYLFPRPIHAFMRFIMNLFPKMIPNILKFMMKSLRVSNYIDKSFIVLDLGNANNLSAYAMELSFPTNTYLDAVEKIIQIVNKSSEDGNQYLTAPFSLRFVKTNAFFLSMQYNPQPGEFVCMIEFPTLNGKIGGIELLARIENEMYAYGGIPHWGQINHLGSSGSASLQTLYPEFYKWHQVYKKFNKKGMFENDFTQRCGINVS